MREIDGQTITQKIVELLLDINTCPSDNLIKGLDDLLKKETSPVACQILNKIIENDLYAKKENCPICQDTGMVICFLEVGYDVHFTTDIYKAINDGVKMAYEKGYFRKSIVKDPFDRINTGDNTPAIIHVKYVTGDKVKLSVMAKGGGSENMSLVKMLTPADGIDGVKELVLETVKLAGGKPCPPIVVGLGIGGSFESSAIMAKCALLREIDDINPLPNLAKYETELKNEINKLGIGPMGLGGNSTCLAVKIQTAPCHIASMPVAINIQCHVSRHKSCII